MGPQLRHARAGLRFFNVFGPLQPPLHTYAAVIPAFLSAAMQGQPLRFHGDGTQCRDFTYVDTVVSVIVDAIQRRVSHLEPLNLAFGQKITLLEVISELEMILDRKLPVDFQPSRVGDVARSQADSSALRRLFPTSCRQGSLTAYWPQQAGFSQRGPGSLEPADPDRLAAVDYRVERRTRRPSFRTSVRTRSLHGWRCRWVVMSCSAWTNASGNVEFLTPDPGFAVQRDDSTYNTIFHR